MKTTHIPLIAVLATIALAGAARAQDPTPAKTRAEVIAELQQARESGELALLHSEIGVNGYQLAPPLTMSARNGGQANAKAGRADLSAEAKRTRAAGEL
ncbi:DUF4148 domain-containing protein [Roseateles violae]|uniref:DUF4148 domain-containing protein n=1 Tax=Roseateles violae TaxID=3058042 RepID=A0ABT8DYH4_9BURK|nr:DUF4148 domain-containing protein [Pelomonas sp. PFR6]MDN3922641.1 DUF4148 domain-containing protein [Pelomonas sp. PFR6]